MKQMSHLDRFPAIYLGFICGFLSQVYLVATKDATPRIISIPGSDSCTRDHMAKLELVYLLDNSEKTLIDNFYPMVLQTSDKLKEYYPGSKFGLSLLSDFECTARNSEDFCKSHDNYHSDPEGCYTFKEALTTDTTLIKSQSSKIRHLSSGGGEGGLEGILLTAAELKMGWSLGNQNINVNKLIVVVTNTSGSDNAQPKPVNGQRMLAKGDGTDKCSTMLAPSAEVLQRTLLNKGISVLVLLANDNPVTGDSWRKSLKQTKGVQWKVAAFEKDGSKMVSTIKDFVTEVAIASPRVTCEDIPAYNTLGL